VRATIAVQIVAGDRLRAGTPRFFRLASGAIFPWASTPGGCFACVLAAPVRFFFAVAASRRRLAAQLCFAPAPSPGPWSAKRKGQMRGPLA
jgi:hypothetical protein